MSAHLLTALAGLLSGAFFVVGVVGAIGYRERYLIADANRERSELDAYRHRTAADVYVDDYRDHRGSFGGDARLGAVRLPRGLPGGFGDAPGRCADGAGPPLLDDRGTINVGRLVVYAAIVSAVGFLTRYGLGGLL